MSEGKFWFITTCNFFVVWAIIFYQLQHDTIAEIWEYSDMNHGQSDDCTGCKQTSLARLFKPLGGKNKASTLEMLTPHFTMKPCLRTTTFRMARSKLNR